MTSAPCNSSSTVTAARSLPGSSEQASLESASGSIGSTAPGTYTLVARSLRLDVQRRALAHVCAHVGDVHPHRDRGVGGI